MRNGLLVRAFLGALSLLFFLFSRVSKSFSLSHKAEIGFAVALLALAVICFGALFGFDGYAVQDWSERARR